MRLLRYLCGQNSVTSPSSVLDRWQDRISIEVWNDADFAEPTNEFENIANCVTKAKQRNPKCGPSTAHLERQEKFYKKCARRLATHHKSNWTTFIDTDEYLTVSVDAFSSPDEDDNNQQLQLLTTKPGHILKLVKHFQRSQLPSERQKYDVSLALYDLFQRSPCVVVPRILISAVESSHDEVNRDVPTAVVPDPTRFDTLRFRYRASGRYNRTLLRQDELGKSVIDLSRMEQKDFNSPSSTTHLVFKSICGGHYKNVIKRRMMQSPGTYAKEIQSNAKRRWYLRHRRR